MMNRVKGLLVGGLFAVVLFRPLISGLTYPWSNTYVQTAIFVLWGVWLVHESWGNRTFFRTNLDIPLLVFLLFLTLSTLKSVSSAVSLDFVYQFMSYILLFFLVTNNLRTQESRRAVIFALFAGAFLVSLYGVYQYFGGLDSTREAVEKSYSGAYPPEFMMRLNTQKVFSTFVFPPALAGFLVLIMPVGISMSLAGRSVVEKALYSFVSMLILSCLVLTFSKGGWLSGVFSITVFASIWLIGIKGIRKAVVVFGLVVSIFAFALLIVCDCLPQATLAGFVGSFGVRLGYWKAIPAMVGDFFLLGSGPGTFGLIYPEYRLILGWETKMAHNNYLQMFVEAGIVGLSAFLWIWVRFLRMGYRLINVEDKDKIIIVGCFSGIIGFMAHSLVDFGLYIPGIAMTVFLFLGLMGSKENLLSPLRFSEKKEVKLLLTAFILVVTVCMIWAVRRPLLGERAFARSIVYAERGEVDKSISFLHKAIGYCPRQAEYYFRLGVMYEGKGPLWRNKAIESYELGLKYNPYVASCHSRLAWLYWNKSRGHDQRLVEKAILEMRNAVSCYPALPKYHMQLGRLYHLAGMYGEARKEYMLTFEHRDAIYRSSRMEDLEKMLQQVEVWLDEIKDET